MQCHWIKDREAGRVLIPGCMGTAVYGLHGCTCNRRKRTASLEQKIVDLEARIEKLEREKRSR